MLKLGFAPIIGYRSICANVFSMKADGDNNIKLYKMDLYMIENMRYVQVRLQDMQTALTIASDS